MDCINNISSYSHFFFSILLRNGLSLSSNRVIKDDIGKVNHSKGAFMLCIYFSIPQLICKLIYLDLRSPIYLFGSLLFKVATIQGSTNT